MPYTAEISRTNPSCFLFLIDQSGSMQEPFGSADGAAAGGKTKAEGLADAINRLLQNLVIKCAKSDGIRDYYHVGVIGYGGKGVGPAFGGALKDKDMVPVSEIANNPMRVEQRVKKTDDGAGGIIEQKIKFPVWFDAMGEGGTPMCTAFITANKLLTKWISEHPNCFPPIVINISDGESSDMDPYQAACDLLSLASTDGEVLLFNLHLSSSKEKAIEYPSSDENLPDDHSKLLYSMSSLLPEYMQKMLSQEGLPVTYYTRGFVFNADLVSVIRFLDIGTRPANLR
ncbi:MAG: hypothetical protein C0507_10695 [Cyanobacteria bacterium PR.3.49]|nr:hypothetical protein [Cyanobacteria bacterium PR.3.49]